MSRTASLWTILILVALLLSACFSPAAPIPAASPGARENPSPTAQQSLPHIEVGTGTSPATTPAPDQGASAPAEGTVWNPRAIATQVQQALAQMLNTSPENVPFLAYEAEVDPATLTCLDQLVGDVPAFGQGEALVFQHEGSKVYVISSGGQLWVCKPNTLASEETLDLEKAKEKALADLARRLNVDPKAIQVVEAKEVTWEDTSLGCPEEGKKYAQILTPGFLVVLQADGQTYEYHGSSRTIFLCGNAKKTSDE